jgi:uncharacterized protein YecT (DUF1311 family)
VAGTVLIAGLLGFLMRPRSDRAEPSGREVAAAGQEASETGASEPVAAAASEGFRPPDREAVRLAYGRAAEVYAAQGASGLAQFGQQCFRSLAQRASYRELDFCLAFDAYAAAMAQKAAGGQPPAADSYFGQTEARQMRVADAVMAGQSDANARMLDIRRLAIEVAREAGPLRVARPTAPAPSTAPAAAPGEASVYAQAEAPGAPRPAPATSPAAPRASSPVTVAPPVRPVPRPTTRANADVEVQPAIEVEPAMPTAAEVAAARPAGRGPSFSCRSARTQAERMICADPDLAALDRRLNAAFEDAIAAGANRRELRAEQDKWLSRREAAAPDPDAVADVYRRRIGELNSMR